MTSKIQSKLLTAAWLSFLVYLLPTSNQHTGLHKALWGLEVWDTLVTGFEDGAILWFAAHIGVAVIVQAMAWLLWFIFLWAHPFIKLLLVPLEFGIILYVTVQSTLWVRLALIPDIQLRTDLRPPPLISWEQTCTVDNAYLLGLDNETANLAWVFQPEKHLCVLVEPPDCRIVRTEKEATGESQSRGQQVEFHLSTLGYPWGGGVSVTSG